mmetsp:Transcript_45149/g.144620  ORF Transcript_45149/g.144620 Transcript_45149/m.144620 type:complete len:300 (+) Transcript_45149:1378-2277(+)
MPRYCAIQPSDPDGTRLQSSDLSNPGTNTFTVPQRRGRFRSSLTRRRRLLPVTAPDHRVAQPVAKLWVDLQVEGTPLLLCTRSTLVQPAYTHHPGCRICSDDKAHTRLLLLVVPSSALRQQWATTRSGTIPRSSSGRLTTARRRGLRRGRRTGRWCRRGTSGCIIQDPLTDELRGEETEGIRVAQLELPCRDSNRQRIVLPPNADEGLHLADLGERSFEPEAVAQCPARRALRLAEQEEQLVLRAPVRARRLIRRGATTERHLSKPLHARHAHRNFLNDSLHFLRRAHHPINLRVPSDP